MKIFNAALRAVALLIALAYLIMLANNQKVAGRYTLGRWGADDAPPVVLDTQTGRVYAVTGTSDNALTLDFVSGTIMSKKLQHK